MAMKNTLILGLAGAAAIYMARKIPAIGASTTNAAFVNNGKTVPFIPAGFMLNPSTPNANWSLAFTLIPAAGALYLSR